MNANYKFQKIMSLGFPMIKSFCYVAIFSFYIVSGNSQISKHKINLKLGVAMNSVYDPNVWAWKFSPLLFGIGIENQYTDIMGFSADFYFLRRGTRSKKRNGIRREDYIFDYLVLAPNLDINLDKKAKLKLKVGPYFGAVLSARIRTTPNEDYENYKHEYFDDFDFGANASIKKDVEIGSRCYFIEGRIQYGLNTFSNTKHKSIQFITGTTL